MSIHEKAQELLAIRTALGFSQSRMAHEIDISLRDYQAFEWGETELPDIYLRAIERIAFLYAMRHNNPMLVPPNLRTEAVQFARMVGTSS
ncbi:DNA-binding XRE family transcriptional regulator [Microvirga flocculans]|uniref:DNA-binding XRE family transcriptional regulator n=1 Tax=Microvirga flocculans TaxID=217168 RepID=A0A7W6IGN6_9HYPH|nr:transcriptional regulator [Microvirga flocculans]MBB4040826.1 DNA-binding XRE family transcriptional regulator [Microvirga flocculans]